LGKSFDDSSVLIDRDTKPANLSVNSLYPSIEYQPSIISQIGSDIEKQRLELLSTLIRKRKSIRDAVVQKLEDLILYCDNRIMDIGDDVKLRADPDAQRAASLWQKTILDLERDKIFEQKELFKDSLFLRNEWIKSLLTYNEEKKVDELIGSIEQKTKP
jgi:hypothetical protein